MKRLLASLIISSLLAGCSGVSPSKLVRRETAVKESRVVADVPAYEYGQVAWDADRGRLLYVGKGPDGRWGPVMLLNLAQPDQPTQLAREAAGSVIWSDDKRSIAYAAHRRDGEQIVATILAKRLDEGEPVDLLPGDIAMKRGFAAGMLEGWFSDGTLAYREHVGTGVQQLFLLDPERKEVFTDQKFLGNFFSWSEFGDRVAGQLQPSFWLWDRKTKQFITPATLPGDYQWFEAWSHDGRSALFTAWDSKSWYGRPGARPTLYRLDVENGHAEKLADDAGLATFYGDLMAYVKFGQRLTLVVADMRSGHVLWTDDLGELSKAESKLPWGYRPTLATTFIGYRTADDEWRVSPLVRKDSRTMFKGPALAAQWSPFGRYLAVHRQTGDKVRLQVLENPLSAGNPVPIEEALRVAYQAAKKWRPNSQVFRVIGQQTYQEREAVPPPGSDGRRRAWAFEFVDPSTGEAISVGTMDGTVTDTINLGTRPPGFDPRQLLVTGKQLVEQAQTTGILAGTGGMAGYQFGLEQYGHRGFVVVVVGVDEHGRPKSIEVDPATGKLLSAR